MSKLKSVIEAVSDAECYQFYMQFINNDLREVQGALQQIDDYLTYHNQKKFRILTGWMILLGLSICLGAKTFNECGRYNEINKMLRLAYQSHLVGNKTCMELTHFCSDACNEFFKVITELMKPQLHLMFYHSILLLICIVVLCKAIVFFLENRAASQPLF